MSACCQNTALCHNFLWDSRARLKLSCKALKGIFCTAAIRYVILHFLSQQVMLAREESLKMSRFGHAHATSLTGVCLDIIIPYMANGSFLNCREKVLLDTDDYEVNNFPVGYVILRLGS